MDAPSLIFRSFVHHFGGVTQTEGAGVTQTEGAGVTQTAYPGVSHTVFEV